MTKRKKAGIILTAIFVVVAIVGLFYTPYSVTQMNPMMRNAAPTLAHPFGMDSLGRDVLSRVMKGMSTTFIIGFFTVLIGVVFGTFFGAVTGYFGGWFDEIVMRINDVLTAFPSILLALIFISIFGSGEMNVILALGILFVPSIARVMRGAFVKEKNMDYVMNAKLMGAGSMRIMFKHIFPNTISVFIPTLTIAFNNAILSEAGMSYLGLGVQPPTPSLGRMLFEAQGYLIKSPWSVIAPGVVILLMIFAFSLLSEQEIPLKRVRKWSEEFTKNRDTKEVLEVKNLNVFIGEKKVIDQFNFHIRKHEIVGIVGESGSGKTMTALSIMGLLPQEAKNVSGSISINGHRPHPGDNVAMIFQEPMTSLNPVMTIGKQLEEVLLRKVKHKSKREEQVMSMLVRVGFSNQKKWLNRYPHELSGGQRQRVMIAMAMLIEPKLMICDEPTTALDVKTQKQILTLLQSINDEYGIAILFISHNMKIVRSLCHYVHVMKDGKQIECGLSDEVFTTPQHEYTKRLVNAMNFVSKKEDVSKNDKILEVKHVNCYYKTSKTNVLEDVNFTLHEGEILGLVGESGGGKTTLSKVLTGILPYDGDIEATKKIGMVFQDPYSSLNPAKTIGWILCEPLRMKKDNSPEFCRKKAIEMLERIGLGEEYMDRYIAELSGGQRQRIATVLALLTEAKILILDEPVSALDVTIQEKVIRFLLNIQKEFQLTYIFISHDQELVERICHRIMHIEGGKLSAC